MDRMVMNRTSSVPNYVIRYFPLLFPNKKTVTYSGELSILK